MADSATYPSLFPIDYSQLFDRLLSWELRGASGFSLILRSSLAVLATANDVPYKEQIISGHQSTEDGMKGFSWLEWG